MQTLDGRWLSIDGRVLYKATVAASETYNTALERHLRDGLGLRFEERTDPDPRKRPVREVVGVDPALNQRWSQRRASIETRRAELAADFQRDHGRPPTPVESLQLAQQATLETREAKHEPRTLAEQRHAWLAQAVEVLGSQRALQRMVNRALCPSAGAAHVADAAWFTAAADRVLAAMQQRRSTWQVWHVRAEAQRQVRAADPPPDRAEHAVDALVREVLDNRSVPLTRGDDGIAEPALLRRADGCSVYTVAGADLYTSTVVLDAERRLLAAAGRRDGQGVPESAVDLALLEHAANGAPLNSGQAALVRTMATSGARLQLAIAPAGAGKTTAMRVLAAAWAEGGGTVIGLAPSAAAAGALREQTGTTTDTLAKLTWSLERGDLPDWAQQIGPSGLVVVDEAGMADTLSLDAAVTFVLDRGGSVRLIGDDQQLAAIGAGGVLRDIQASHGALHLTELLRFADSAEGAASLALREGRTEALGFYLDRQRVHVGDLTTMTEDVFGAWQADRGNDLDSVMLAPTRELAGELNRRARAHRLAGSAGPAGPVVRLADGNDASAGDLLITRANDRRLRTSATDWVKNGDRWTLLAIGRGGGLTVKHTRTGRTVRLPRDYVREAVELGYATTVHTAQGVSVDTTHGLVSGAESRQQLYTMLTRGRLANHVYLEVVGDGDPHSVIRPELIRPLTPTDLLEQILARDDAPRSATTVLREAADPATLLGRATQRYADALYVAAEDVVGRGVAQGLDDAADNVIRGLCDEPAWPALRSHLLLLGASGADPVQQLRAAADQREVVTAGDTAAVLDWRLDDSGLRGAGPGPLPWLPAIPPALSAKDRWGDYLTRRSQLVTDLAEQVRAAAARDDDTPVWAPAGVRPPVDVTADVQVWRAAMQVEPQDRRPTGAPQLQKAAATWQRALDRRVTGDRTPALAEWGELLERAAPAVRGDAFVAVLAERLAATSRAGLDARGLLRSAVAADPLPDDHAAAALWWRISRHLSPAVAEHIDRDHALATPWTPRLTEFFGAQRAEAIQSSRWWPALVTAVDHGLQRGWRLQDLLAAGVTPSAPGEDDDCQAMTWRISVLTDPAPITDEPADPFGDGPPADMWDAVEPPEDAFPLAELGHHSSPAAAEDVDVTAAQQTIDEDFNVESELVLAGMLRDVLGPPEPTDADIARLDERALAWEQSPVGRDRMLEINQLALRYFQDQFHGSWGRRYLAERLGTDLHGDPRFRPGQAPAGWTGLVDHLRGHGVSDLEMLATGVATTASTGRLIDRFRDRVVFPITHGGEVLGFVGRRHPDLTDADRGGPKYLNTAETPLFHKGAQLFGALEEHLADGAIPVVVEGPLDAVAVTIATGGSHVGVAPLGTSLTDQQAAQLALVGADPIVATDADLAGRVAAERAYWMLTPHGLDPTYAQFPAGSDPADLLALRGPKALAETLAAARPLADVLIDERLANLPHDRARSDATRVLAARPSPQWDAGSERISSRLHVALPQVRGDLHAWVREWNTDPRRAGKTALQDLGDVRARLNAAARKPVHHRWAPLAEELDPRLLRQGDWPALAAAMQDAQDQGHDVATVSRRLVAESALSDPPAQDLRYRLVCRLDLDIDDPGSAHQTLRARTPTGAHDHPQRPATLRRSADLRR